VVFEVLQHPLLYEQVKVRISAEELLDLQHALRDFLLARLTVDHDAIRDLDRAVVAIFVEVSLHVVAVLVDRPGQLEVLPPLFFTLVHGPGNFEFLPPLVEIQVNECLLVLAGEENDQLRVYCLLGDILRF
jgi:hypothetical protein